MQSDFTIHCTCLVKASLTVPLGCEHVSTCKSLPVFVAVAATVADRRMSVELNTFFLDQEVLDTSSSNETVTAFHIRYCLSFNASLPLTNICFTIAAKIWKFFL